MHFSVRTTHQSLWSFIFRGSALGRTAAASALRSLAVWRLRPEAKGKCKKSHLQKPIHTIRVWFHPKLFLFMRDRYPKTLYLSSAYCRHRSFRVTVARAWNSLPTSIKALTSLPPFKRQLKTFLFTKSFQSINFSL